MLVDPSPTALAVATDEEDVKADTGSGFISYNVDVHEVCRGGTELSACRKRLALINEQLPIEIVSSPFAHLKGSARELDIWVL